MKIPIISNISSWSIPDLIDLPAKAIVYFILVNSLDKEVFGMLNLAMMVFSYHALSQVGVVDWLIYELPKKFILKQNMKKTLSESYCFTLINQSILSLLICILLVAFDDNFFIFVAVLVYLLHSFFYNLYLHKTLFLRYQYKFKKLLKLRVFFTLIRFFLEIIAIIYFGIYGYLTIQALIFIIPIVLLKSDINFDFKLTMKLDKYKSLALNGLPFFVVTMLSIILGNMDKWFIVSTYGLEWFATYSVGIFIVTAILIVPGKVLSIFTQYLKELFIVIHDRNLNIIRSYSVNNFLLLLLLLLISLITVGNIFEYLVMQYLPKYIEVIPFINVLMLSILLKYSVSLSANVLYLLERRADVAKIQTFIAALYILVLSIIYVQDYGILSVLWGVNFILLSQIIINLLIIFSVKDFDFDFEILRFAMLIIISFSYYFFKDFFVFIIPWLVYMLIILLTCMYQYKSMWKSLSYVSTRSFEKY